MEVKGSDGFYLWTCQKSLKSHSKTHTRKIKKYEKKYSEKRANVTAQENREAIDKLENYIGSVEL